MRRSDPKIIALRKIFFIFLDSYYFNRLHLRPVSVKSESEKTKMKTLHQYDFTLCGMDIPFVSVASRQGSWV